MCGRFSKTKDERDEEIRDLVDPKRIHANLAPRYNIAPSQSVSLIRLGTENEPELCDLQWGFVPHWLKELDGAPRPINAKGETVIEKPFFRSAFRKRRCLVLADGFYEWKKTDDGKQPFYIRMKTGELFAFAGLWDYWGEDSALETCTIITTEPNSLCSDIHNRMPVILERKDYNTWLSVDTKMDNAAALLQPYSSELMEAFAVSKHVNSPRNDDVRCVAPI